MEVVSPTHQEQPPQKAHRGWGHPPCMSQVGGVQDLPPPCSSRVDLWIWHPQGDTQQLSPEQDKAGGGMQLASCQKAQRGGVTRGQDPQDGGGGGTERQGRGSEELGAFWRFLHSFPVLLQWGGGGSPSSSPHPTPKHKGRRMG